MKTHNNPKYPLDISALDTSIKYLDRFVIDSCFRGGIPSIFIDEDDRNKMERLEAYHGRFSSVYPITVGSKKFALRCCPANILEKDVEYRYQEIDQYFYKTALPYFVRCAYVQKGIRIGGGIYPIIRMEWAEGIDLKSFIGQNLDKPSVLLKTAFVFYNLVNDLHKHHISHGDLQADNIIIGVNEGNIEIKLIDYEGMCVPNLKGLPSDILGSPFYQHPKRIKMKKAKKAILHEKVDYFSELVIYLSLLSLAEKPELWKICEQHEGGLLFSQQDFEDPLKSSIFHELATLSEHVRYLTSKLKVFCYADDVYNLSPLEEVDRNGINIPVRFKLTRQSFNNLRNEKVPDNILEGLKTLEDQELLDERNFLNVVEKQIKKEQTVRYKELILKHASISDIPNIGPIEPPRPPRDSKRSVLYQFQPYYSFKKQSASAALQKKIDEIFMSASDELKLIIDSYCPKSPSEILISVIEEYCIKEVMKSKKGASPKVYKLK